MPPNYPQLAALRHGLIVSCQASAASPLNHPAIIAALGQAAELGGAAGLRIDGPENVAAVRRVSRLPIIGIYKIHTPGSEVYITPIFAAAQAVVAAGADLLAVDATGRARPGGETFREIVAQAHAQLGVPVMADVGTHAQGLQALEDGADLVATTLSTSAPYGRPEDGPGLRLARALATATDRPIVVEGQVWTPDQARACLAAGAYAVVIGSAITAPELITRRFLNAMRARA